MKIAKAAIASSLGIDPSSMNKVSDGLCQVHQKIASSIGIEPLSMKNNLSFDIYHVNLNHEDTKTRVIATLRDRIRRLESTLNLPHDDERRIASTKEHFIICKAFFLTDLAEQMTALILASPPSIEIDDTFMIMTKMAGTPKTRLKMASRGIVTYLAKFATRGDSEFLRARLFLCTYAYYLTDEDITQCLVDRILAEPRGISLFVLSRLAWRGCLDHSYMDRLISYSRKHMGNKNPGHLIESLSVSSALRFIDNRRTPPTQYEFLVGQLRRYVFPNDDVMDAQFILSSDFDSHAPLCMNLMLLGSNDSDVRFIGALRLAVQLGRHKSCFHEFWNNIPSTDDFEKQARLALPLDDTESAERSHSFVATNILKLRSDPDPHVCRLGKHAWNNIPVSVRRHVTWCTSLHKYIPSDQKNMVTTMLKLSKRSRGNGGIPLPEDVLIRFVFPFACDFGLDDPIVPAISGAKGSTA